MKPSSSEPRPEDFPLGSLKSRAAARLLAEKRKARLIPVMCIQIRHVGAPDGKGLRAPWYIGLDPKLVKGDWDSWMTRKEFEAANRAPRSRVASEESDKVS